MNDAVNDIVKALPGLCVMADALPHATLVFDRQGLIVVANGLVSRTLGVSDDCALEGRTTWQVLPAGLREVVAAMQREVLIYASDARRDFRMESPGAEPLELDLHLAGMGGTAGQPGHFCLVISNAQHRQEVAELKKLDHLKSNFLAMISHELRTPLTSIRGAVHLLAESELPSSESAGALVNIIHSNSERLIRLVNNLLEMVAIDNETFGVARVEAYAGPLIKQALDRHLAVAKSKFITLQQDVDDVHGLVDPERIVQLVSYLVDNAIKFTPPGGRIVVAARQLAQGEMELSVSDTGCGVPVYAREKVFEKFYQVEDAMTRCCGGAGVGLYLARHIVALHGGRIWLDANPDGGADFHALFPSATAQGGAEIAEKKSAP